MMCIDPLQTQCHAALRIVILIPSPAARYHFTGHAPAGSDPLRARSAETCVLRPHWLPGHSLRAHPNPAIKQESKEAEVVTRVVSRG